MQNAITTRPLIRVFVPEAAWQRDAALVFAASLFVALSAYIKVPLPFTPVPITGQTLAVLMTGAVLGSRLGGLAMVTYLAEGLAGLPVFAGGASAWTPSTSPLSPGVPAILATSAGYLYAYPFAAFLVGWLAEHGWDRSVVRAAAAMLIGNVVIYASGLSWLALYVGPAAAIPMGLLPFIPGDLVKIGLAAAALPGAWRLVRGRAA